MNRSEGPGLSLLLAILAPAILIGSFLAARAEADLARAEAESTAGPIGCNPPAGWAPVQVQPGDNLALLASRSGIPLETLETANCLGREVEPGDFVYLPATPAGSPTPCGPPPDWILRQVAEGETLRELAQELDVSEPELRAANCLGPFTTVLTGVRIYAPQTATPTSTNTPRPTATRTASLTPSATSSAEPTATESATIPAP